MEKDFIDHILNNTDTKEQFVLKFDTFLNAPWRKKPRNLINKMSSLEIIFLGSFYYKIKPLILKEYADWMAYFQSFARIENKTPISPLLRFQYKCGKFKIDFAIIRKSIKLTIELDGFQWHDKNSNQFDYERERQNFLVSKDFTVLRFTWQAVTQRFDDVYCQIMDIIEKAEIKYYQE